MTIGVFGLVSLLFLNVENGFELECPRNLDAALETIIIEWSNDDLEFFASINEDLAVLRYHQSLGIWIRNSWLNANSCPQLVKYFHDLGIKGVDDMSSIIIRSLHRRLNAHEIGLAAQLSSKVTQAGLVDECEKKRRQSASILRNSLKIGDNVEIQMKRVPYGDGFNSVIEGCGSSNWESEYDSTVLFGRIVRVFDNGDQTFPFIELQLDSIIPTAGVKVLMKQVNVGSSLTLPLVGINLAVKHADR